MNGWRVSLLRILTTLFPFRLSGEEKGISSLTKSRILMAGRNSRVVSAMQKNTYASPEAMQKCSAVILQNASEADTSL